MREFVYPATNASVLIALISFFLLLEFAAFGGVLGLFLAFLVLPALMRYLMLLHSGEQVSAVKLMLRCRLVNDALRPLPEDAALALKAAEDCHNHDLLRFLQQ